MARMWRADRMASSIAGCNRHGFFNIGTFRGAHLGFRSQGCRRSRGIILLAAVKVVDFKVLRRV